MPKNMKVVILVILSVWLVFPAWAVQLGGAGNASGEKVNATLEVISGVKFSDGSIQTTANGASLWAPNGSKIYNTNLGNVGIAAADPAATLEVGGSILSQGTAGGTPVSGMGTRFMWIPAKAALRAGKINNDEWDDAFMGSYSVAFGEDTQARGDHSFAMGYGSTATGESSVAIGAGNLAEGRFSIALGTSSNALNEGSIAIGSSVSSSGLNSVALGSGTFATNEAAFAAGSGTRAEGSISTALGDRSTASGAGAIAMGGKSTASGDRSVAIGDSVTAVGVNGLALGKNVTAQADNTIAMGQGKSNTEKLTNNTAGSLMVGFTGTKPILFVSGEAVSGRIGIGTSEPSSKLTVAGTIELTAGSGGGMKFNDGSIQTTAVNSSIAGGWIKSTGKVTLEAENDFVGVGTPEPTEQLEITKNFNLPASTATVGVIKSSGNRYIHNAGTSNFFAGVNAGNLTTPGSNNVGIGFEALQSNNSANFNTAIGYQALKANTDGLQNVAIGAYALTANTTGTDNFGLGQSALLLNTVGSHNVAIGSQALTTNDSGNRNTGIGEQALNQNTTSENTAIGYYALQQNTTGSGNTAVGNYAGWQWISNITGSNNTFIGYNSGAGANNLTNATAVGYNAKVDASNSLVLGGTGANAVNVGIGTSEPASKLTVAGTIELAAGSGGGIKFADNTIQTTANGANSWLTSGTNIYNTNAGNVGIGTTEPSAKLHVEIDSTLESMVIVSNKNSSSVAEVQLWNETGQTVSFFSTGTNFSDIPLAANACGLVSVSTQPLLFATIADTDIKFSNNLSNYSLVIKGAGATEGFVGIGTSEPAANLEVTTNRSATPKLQVSQYNGWGGDIDFDTFKLMNGDGSGSDYYGLSFQYNPNNNSHNSYGLYLKCINSAGSPGDTYGIYSKIQIGDLAPVYGIYSEIDDNPSGTPYPAYAVYGKIDIPGARKYAAVFEGGNVGIGTTEPTAALDVAGSTGYNQVRMRTSYTPTGNADANGNVGDIAWDASYVYVKTGGGWKRSSLEAW